MSTNGIEEMETAFAELFPAEGATEDTANDTAQEAEGSGAPAGDDNVAGYPGTETAPESAEEIQPKPPYTPPRPPTFVPRTTVSSPYPGAAPRPPRPPAPPPRPPNYRPQTHNQPEVPQRAHRPCLGAPPPPRGSNYRPPAPTQPSRPPAQMQPLPAREENAGIDRTDEALIGLVRLMARHCNEMVSYIESCPPEIRNAFTTKPVHNNKQQQAKSGISGSQKTQRAAAQEVNHAE